MFDVTVQAIALEITGAEDHVSLGIIVGLSLPAGPQGIIPIPAGAIRVLIGREPAIIHGKELVEAGEGIPEPAPASDLVIAQNMQSVDRAAKLAEQFRGQPS